VMHRSAKLSKTGCRIKPVGAISGQRRSAHYEFICKSGGVPVHYCAEQFPNDDTPSATILKAVKRSMAGEYSR
jgi:hypothetical protein